MTRIAAGIGTLEGERVDGRVERPRCAGHQRHWFTIGARKAGHTGLRSPVCVRCGAPNPLDLTTDDWLELGELFPERYGEIAEKVRDQLDAGSW